MLGLELQQGLESTQSIYSLEWGFLKMISRMPADVLLNPDQAGQLQVVDLCLLTGLNLPPHLSLICAAQFLRLSIFTNHGKGFSYRDKMSHTICALEIT